MTRPNLLQLLADLRTDAEGLAATNPELSSDEVAFFDTLEGISDSAEIVDRFGARLIEAEAMAEAAAQMAKDLRARADRLSKRADSAKVVLAMIVDAVAPIPNDPKKPRKIERPAFTAYFRRNAKKLVADAQKLPLEYLEFPDPPPARPNASLIRAALEGGELVEGAKLEDAEPSFIVSKR